MPSLGLTGGWLNISGSIRELYIRTIASLRKPGEFFASIEEERGIGRPFIFLLIVFSVTFLFLTYHHVELFNSILQQLARTLASQGYPVPFKEIELNSTSYALIYLGLVISQVLITFFWYYVTHLCVRLVGGSGGYDQTYKAMTYSLSADYLTLPAFAVSLVSLTTTIASRSSVALAVFIISTILYLIPSLYRLYLRLVGIEKLQSISKLRAFIAAYVLAYGVLLLAIFLFEAGIIAIVIMLS